MSLQNFLAEMEDDYGWREQELVDLDNAETEISSVSEEMYRRATILLVYAHMEGFCQFCLLHYVRFVNQQELTCGEVSYRIAASCMKDVFHDLRYPESKTNDLDVPDAKESSLVTLAREDIFLEKISQFYEEKAQLSDKVVDLESNLKPIVLRKNLFRLGLSYSLFDDYMGDIHRLLRVRNDIAHGSRKSGIKKNEYEEMRDSGKKVMEGVKHEISQAVKESRFCRDAG